MMIPSLETHRDRSREALVSGWSVEFDRKTDTIGIGER